MFGAADEFVGLIKADVAVIFTHSDVTGIKLVATQFAPVVIDVQGERIAESPERFDATARAWRAGAFPYGIAEAVPRNVRKRAPVKRDDDKLADDIRKAYRRRCIAIDRATEAGLSVECLLDTNDACGYGMGARIRQRDVVVTKKL